MIRWIKPALLISLIACSPAWVAFGDTTTNQPVADSPAEPGFIASLTSSDQWHAWHRRWSSNVFNTAEYIDNFFADPKLDRESNGSRIKLSLGMKVKDGEGFGFISRANVRLSLPGTSKRLKLIFEDENESEETGAASEALQSMRETNKDAGLRYNVRQKRRYSIDVDGGYRTSSDQFFGRIRGKRDFTFSDNVKFRLTQSASYYTEDEWVSDTEFDINIQMRDEFLFRSESDLKWAEDIEGVGPAQTFVFFKPLSKRKAIRYEIGGEWPESPGPTETRYFTSFTYRSLVHSDWIYLEIEPGVEFPQIHDYDPKSFLLFKFDFVFGKLD